jgi:hypothetical protein
MRRHTRTLVGLLPLLMLALAVGCTDSPSGPDGGDEVPPRTPQLALWLAKKGELIAHQSASYDLVMSGWFEPAEAAAILQRRPSAKLLAGLSLTWVFNSEDWMSFLVTVANGGDPNGPLQITDDMYLMFDDDEDGVLDRRCSPPGWEDEIYAMDPRHEDWAELILSFYEVVGEQSQHDGVIVDMLDAYPFCEGAWSGGVEVPLDSDGWVDGQELLLAAVRADLHAEKWVIANAGRDFEEGSPFPQYLNGYLLENALGTQFGVETVAKLRASATRALETTNPPHIVVYAVDTDDTGDTTWSRFRRGLAGSLMMDNTYFAFDYGPRDHGGVDDWWFEQYYDVDLGEPVALYCDPEHELCSREFTGGYAVVTGNAPVALFLDGAHVDVATGVEGEEFTVPPFDGRILVRIAERTGSAGTQPMIVPAQ